MTDLRPNTDIFELINRYRYTKCQNYGRKSGPIMRARKKRDAPLRVLARPLLKSQLLPRAEALRLQSHAS